MKKRLMICMLLLITMVISGCSKTASSMTNLDKEFNKYAEKAANEFLQTEADDYTWTTVETGELEYEYTLYNEELDTYEVNYLAEFDAADEPEDEWIEISVILMGNSKTVDEVNCSYWNAQTYEYSYGQNVGSRSDKDGIWYNVNLTDEERNEVKERYQ